MPLAMQWKGVADLIARGLSNLPTPGIVSMIAAATLAAFIEIMTIIRKSRFHCGRVPLVSA